MPKGGYRPGAGRPQGSATVRLEREARRAPDPMAYLLSIVRDPHADPARRGRAAIALRPYLHVRADVAVRRDAAAEVAAADAERGTEWEGLLT